MPQYNRPLKQISNQYLTLNSVDCRIRHTSAVSPSTHCRLHLIAMNSTIAVSKTELQTQQLLESTQNHARELFLEHGALWLKNAIPRSFVDELACAYQQSYTDQPIKKLRKKHAVVGDQRFMISIKLKPPFNDPLLYANDILFPLVQSILGSQCVISSFGSVLSFPGAQHQPIHFDHPPLFESPEACGSIPPYALTVVIPLVDINQKTGSTAIWEGSHRRATARQELGALSESPQWSQASVPSPDRGDAYLMDYRVIHGGMPNNADYARPILYLVYSRPWFQDTFNFNDQKPVRFAAGERKKIPQKFRHLFANH